MVPRRRHCPVYTAFSYLLSDPLTKDKEILKNWFEFECVGTTVDWAHHTDVASFNCCYWLLKYRFSLQKKSK